MSDFKRLTAKEKLALERYELNARLRRRFKLVRLASHASLRLIGVFTDKLDARRSHDAQGLALFAQRAGPEYERLAGLDRAILYAHDIAMRTLRATGIRLPR